MREKLLLLFRRKRAKREKRKKKNRRWRLPTNARSLSLSRGQLLKRALAALLRSFSPTRRVCRVLTTPISWETRSLKRLHCTFLGQRNPSLLSMQKQQQKPESLLLSTTTNDVGQQLPLRSPPLAVAPARVSRNRRKRLLGALCIADARGTRSAKRPRAPSAERAKE